MKLEIHTKRFHDKIIVLEISTRLLYIKGHQEIFCHIAKCNVFYCENSFSKMPNHFSAH